MSRDFKLPRRNSSKNLKFEETENVPVNSNLREPSVVRLSTDSYSRPPLNTIQEPQQNPSKSDYELGLKSSKIYKTPTKPKIRNLESGIPLKTPEKQACLARNRYGWGQDPCRTLSRGSSGFQESNSTHSTPTKSVTKPVNLGVVNGVSSRPPVNGGIRIGNFTALSKGIPVAYNACTTVNTVEVPHFDLREDPSFWMDHNVQVLIRIRPLNGSEISAQGYNRCLKQESSQSLTWVAQPETRFTFDHVACETIDQETLFKMVGQPMVENCLSGYNSCMFAYGQTGSGKTHTMLGEINDLETKPSSNRGMTPRIFEFLFARIFAEEESRKDERLEYTCKCSFLEIYNEQITDLLDPSSTNLQLREDVKTGVYVENLTEYEVHCVGDILKLLSQGSANRRVAATNMNRESSRSHSVFTCVIESRWEKDSTSNLRFARLNLVDLAGSERQKTSGAEGERLKEAANINKSLSTLGHVIMVLVDGANARTRHVPYRDSRLTFLLQDSLGGNSKTMIIANVSPSISSATETLNTLKFAQRAKLIQNNAVINEDASGDVVALQNQIRLLKEELAILKRQNTSRSLTFSSKDENCSNASSYGVDDKVLRVSCNQLKSLESSLNGSLRREKSTENCIKQLEAEIEQLNCLVRQREEENRCTKMMLKFREDKIQKMESVFTGLISADSYLIEENNTLTEEIKILQAKVDRNPEVTRFAVENIRLLEQLKRFQDFYEEGERETLLAEVSELRDQLALALDEINHMNLSIKKDAAEDKKEIDSLQSELKKTHEELEKCRDNLNSCLEENTKLCSEIFDLNASLEKQKSSPNDQDVGVPFMKDFTLEFSLTEDQSSQTVEEKDEIYRKYPEEIMSLNLEIEFLKHILEEERLILKETEDKFSLATNSYEKSILKEKETQQELTLLREKCEEKDRNFDDLSEEFDFLTNKIEEVLTVGCNALDDASNFIGHGKQTTVCENLQIIARKISEKELRIDELNMCLEDAKIRGNEMETMLRSLRGAILVMSEAHQKDCIRKDEEIDELLSELNEKNSIMIQMEKQTKLYEIELMDTMKNTTQKSLESCYYIDKYEETQHKIEEANCMIDNLVNEKEAMKIEIEDLKRKEINFIREIEILSDNCSVLEKQLSEKIEGLRCSEDNLVTNLFAKDIELSMMSSKLEQVIDEKDEELRCSEEKLVKDLYAKDIELFMMSSKLEQLIDEKDEELRCSEEKLVKDLFAKDIELFMMSSKLQQVGSENDNLAKDKIIMSKAFEKFKEEIIVSHMDLQCKDLILMELDADLRLQKEENETLVVKIKKQKDEIEGVFEALECELYENIVKSLVLESRLTENVVDALNAKKSMEDQLTYFQELYKVELTDTKIKVQEADIRINKLLTENEELKTEISHQNQVINAKETELFIILSKLEQVASDNNDLEKEKINVCSVFEKLKEQIFISYLDLHFKDLILQENDAAVGALEIACEERKRDDEEKLKLYEKTVEELESTVVLLENQVDLVKGDAETQRSKKEELEEEVKKMYQQKQLLITENETFKTENEVFKIKVTDLEDEIKKLLGKHQQNILPLEKIKEDNNVLKERNDKNATKLRKAEEIVARVMKEVANVRASY